MPLGCPIGFIPFFAPDACDDCRYNWRERCIYYGIKDAVPLTEILTLPERIALLERLGPEKKESPMKASQSPEKSPPKLTGGVKL